MKLIMFVAVVLLGVLATIEAFSRYQNVPYHPLATRPPPLIRFSRQALSGQVSSNPAGGADAKLEIAKGSGSPDHYVNASAFAAGNTNKSPVASGGSLEQWNISDHRFALIKEYIFGVRDSFRQSAAANLFNGGTAFKSQNTLANGFEFEGNGGGLSWANQNGHGAAASLSRIPDFGIQLELAGKANLWSSLNKNTRLNWNAGASHWYSEPFSVQRNFGGRLGLTPRFSG